MDQKKEEAKWKTEGERRERGKEKKKKGRTIDKKKAEKDFTKRGWGRKKGWKERMEGKGEKQGQKRKYKWQ